MRTRIQQPEFGHRRRGLSLVEVLVVVALSSLVLGVVISLLVGLRQWDRRFLGRAVECDRLIELADALRADIRRATEFGVPSERQLTITTSTGAETRYELGPRGCTRTAETADAVGRRTELYAVGRAAAWHVERDATGRRPLVKVTLDRIGSETETPRRVPLLVYGALGADLFAEVPRE
jgi:prepilin-type N-terminal cleavage/methylation domain-containing protein